jgi:phage terminase large subunit-like protein
MRSCERLIVRDCLFNPTVVAKKDAKDNVYPRKAREDNKIDPAVALIANLSLQLIFEVEEPSPWADARMAVM